jgi:hypothetical protein
MKIGREGNKKERKEPLENENKVRRMRETKRHYLI